MGAAVPAPAASDNNAHSAHAGGGGADDGSSAGEEDEDDDDDEDDDYDDDDEDEDEDGRGMTARWHNPYNTTFVRTLEPNTILMGWSNVGDVKSCVLAREDTPFVTFCRALEDLRASNKRVLFQANKRVFLYIQDQIRRRSEIKDTAGRNATFMNYDNVPAAGRDGAAGIGRPAELAALESADLRTSTERLDDIARLASAGRASGGGAAAAASAGHSAPNGYAPPDGDNDSGGDGARDWEKSSSLTGMTAISESDAAAANIEWRSGGAVHNRAKKAVVGSTFVNSGGAAGGAAGGGGDEDMLVYTINDLSALEMYLVISRIKSVDSSFYTTAAFDAILNADGMTIVSARERMRDMLSADHIKLAMRHQDAKEIAYRKAMAFVRDNRAADPERADDILSGATDNIQMLTTEIMSKFYASVRGFAERSGLVSSPVVAGVATPFPPEDVAGIAGKLGPPGIKPNVRVMKSGQKA